MKTLCLLFLALVFSEAHAGDVLIYKAKAVSGGVNSQVWYVHNEEEWQGQTYGSYSSQLDEFTELNLTIGPKTKLANLLLVFPVGLRFRPSEGMNAAHAIGKVNAFGNIGKLEFSAIHDLSFPIDQKESTEHYLEYQGVYQTRWQWICIGAHSSLFLYDGETVSKLVGPLLRLSGQHLATEIVPYRDFESRSNGIKVQITLRF